MNRTFSIWGHLTSTARNLILLLLLLLLSSRANEGYCSLLSTGITKFKFKKENEMNSGGCSQVTLS